MSHRQVYQVNGKRQLLIELPEELKNSKKLIVTIDDAGDSLQEKINLLAEAASDPLYLADIKEVTNEFDAIDNEISWHSNAGASGKQTLNPYGV